jgi:hypothetical protein
LSWRWEELASAGVKENFRDDWCQVEITNYRKSSLIYGNIAHAGIVALIAYLLHLAYCWSNLMPDITIEQDVGTYSQFYEGELVSVIGAASLQLFNKTSRPENP